MEKTITSIRRAISRDHAGNILAAVSGGFHPQVQKLVFYPYLWTHYSFPVKTLFGEKTIRAFILVDLLNNIASTADSFELEEIETDEATVIPSSVTPDIAGETAGTYLLHSTIHKMKLLHIPKATTEQRKIIYKPFWIVKCTNRNRDTFRVLVDGVTGKYEILNTEGDQQ